MRLIVFVFLMSTANMYSQKPANPIKNFDVVKEKVKEERQKIFVQEMSIDIQSILIDFIPKLVLKDRTIRYQWDKRKYPDIYVYRHLIEYDSIQFYEDCVFKFRNSPKSKVVDTSFILKRFPFLDFDEVLYRYTKLPCFDDFGYEFIFVDDILKADFVLSSLKKNTEDINQSLYIWYIPNISTCYTYNVSASQPWNNDCYQTQILDKTIIHIDYPMEEGMKLQEIRISK